MRPWIGLTRMRLRPGSVLMMSLPVCRASAVSATSSVVAVMAIGESAARAAVGAPSASSAATMPLEHRAEKREPVFSASRYDDNGLERATAADFTQRALVAGPALWRDNPTLAITTPPCTDQPGDMWNVLVRVAGQANHAGKGTGRQVRIESDIGADGAPDRRCRLAARRADKGQPPAAPAALGIHRDGRQRDLVDFLPRDLRVAGLDHDRIAARLDRLGAFGHRDIEALAVAHHVEHRPDVLHREIARMQRERLAGIMVHREHRLARIERGDARVIM